MEDEGPRMKDEGLQTLLFCFALLLFLNLSTNASAQSSAEIHGRVIDEHGANIVGAEVRLSSRTGLQLFASTDTKGSFQFGELGQGSYFAEIKAPGFATFTSAEIQLARGQTENLDFKLKVATISESV